MCLVLSIASLSSLHTAIIIILRPGISFNRCSISTDRQINNLLFYLSLINKFFLFSYLLPESSEPLKPLAKGLYSIFNCVTFRK